jgi:hypothetical protein
MKKLVLLWAAGAAALLASGCASDGGYVGGDVGVSRFGWGAVAPGPPQAPVRDLPTEGMLGPALTNGSPP